MFKIISRYFLISAAAGLAVMAVAQFVLAETVIIGENQPAQVSGEVMRVARDYFVLKSGQTRFEVHVDALDDETPVNKVIRPGQMVTATGEFAGERLGRAQFNAYSLRAFTGAPVIDDAAAAAAIAPAAGAEAVPVPVIREPSGKRVIYSSPKGSFKVIGE